MEQISKQKFFDKLKEEGFITAYENGMPIVICQNEYEMKKAVKEIKDIAKKNGYNESLGARVMKSSEKFAETSNEENNKLDEAV